jgi:hypothetical protein
VCVLSLCCSVAKRHLARRNRLLTTAMRAEGALGNIDALLDGIAAAEDSCVILRVRACAHARGVVRKCRLR